MMDTGLFGRAGDVATMGSCSVLPWTSSSTSRMISWHRGSSCWSHLILCRCSSELRGFHSVYETAESLPGRPRGPDGPFRPRVLLGCLRTLPPPCAGVYPCCGRYQCDVASCLRSPGLARQSLRLSGAL